MKASVCPNCGSDKIDENNYCPDCDVQYKITKEAVTPQAIGRMDQLEVRVKNIETSIGESPPHILPEAQDQPAPTPADPESEPDPDEPDTDQDNDEDDFLPR